MKFIITVLIEIIITWRLRTLIRVLGLTYQVDLVGFTYMTSRPRALAFKARFTSLGLFVIGATNQRNHNGFLLLKGFSPLSYLRSLLIGGGILSEGIFHAPAIYNYLLTDRDEL